MKTAHLAAHLAVFLKDRATHDSLPGLAEDLGFHISSVAGGDKKSRVADALEGKNDRDIAEIAIRAGNKFGDIDLSEQGFAILEKDDPPLTEITRRDVAKCFGDDLAGNRNLVELVGSWFSIGNRWTEGWLRDRTLAQEIEQHMVLNFGDWSVEKLFEEIGALTCSRSRFAALVQDAVHPLARRGDDQHKLCPPSAPVGQKRVIA